MAQSLLAPGAVLSGRYQVVEVIGESDLSRVYEATDRRGQAQVALKVFDHAVMARAAALSEYQAHARQASGLGVEGIARAYDFGIDANAGVPFSTAERIGWLSLDRRVAAEGPLGVMDLSRGFAVLARALDAAHGARLIHRDLKPQNVFISPQNPEWVRITDFGVSALRRGAPEAMGWGGPPGYTPPEAVDASAPGSPRVDLFALGVIAFFALTRGTPFRSLRSPRFDPNAHWAELNQPLGRLSERATEIGVALDPAFDPWFGRALALAPDERFGSAGEMVRELAMIAEQVSAQGRRGHRTMPGIAAAIAQPLLFQPEPSPASLGLASSGAPASRTATTTAPLPVAVAPAPGAPAPVSSSLLDDEPLAPVPKKAIPRAALLGGAVVLLGALAAAGYAALRSDDHTEPESHRDAAPSGTPSVAATAASANPRARFKCRPEACDEIVCDGAKVTDLNGETEFAAGTHECTASRRGYGSKSSSFTATAGQVAEVEFELAALPAATPSKATTAPAKAASAPASPAKTAKATSDQGPSATKVAPKQPAAVSTTAKTAPSKSTKKKCSTFLGCK